MIYLSILRFGFLRNIAYPVKIYSTILQSIIQIGFMIIFWSVVFQDKQEQIRYLASYFLIADGVGRITMSTNTMLGRNVRHLIKYGGISSYLVVPIKIIPYMYFSVLGSQGVYYLIGIITIILGILVNGSLSVLQIFMFICFLVCAILIGLSFNLFESALSFIFTEVSGFKNALNHITRMLSGAFIPLTFFPDQLESIIRYLPFPWAVFGPTNALTIQEFNSEVTNSLLIALFWAVTLMLLTTIFWKKVSKNYEATGL